MFTDTQKQKLLQLARQSIQTFLQDKKILEPDGFNDEIYQKHLGAFVTLHEGNGDLRGCIGTFDTKDPIYKNIINYAVIVAVEDNRFTPVTLTELNHLKLEISVLTEMQTCTYDEIKPGEDGVYITYKNRNATFLPQVWEDIPDKDSFFRHLKMKAGIPLDIPNQDLDIKKYQAIVFHE